MEGKGEERRTATGIRHVLPIILHFIYFFLLCQGIQFVFDADVKLRSRKCGHVYFNGSLVEGCAFLGCICFGCQLSRLPFLDSFAASFVPALIH